MSLTYLKDNTDTSKDVFYENGVRIGELYVEIDGYWAFDPDRSNGGFWTEEVLSEIDATLRVMNEAWDHELQEALARAGS